VPRKLIVKKTDKVLRGVQPNAGIEAAYRAKMQALIAEMDKSVVYWLRVAYRANEPVMAQDRTPADELRDAIRKLAKRWQKNFDEAAPALAEYFAQAVADRSSGALMAILKKAGFTVKFKMTRAMRDVMAATVGQQVSLIKSIPSRYFTNIEGLVIRSVQSGRDLAQLTQDLQQQFGVTHRRVAFLARDQNNKATASMTRARQDELGLNEAIWGAFRRRQASSPDARRHARQEIRREQRHVGLGRQSLDLPRRGNQLPLRQSIDNSGVLMSKMVRQCETLRAS
jgi:uncharacterized protein with gpF-like domain